jgi:hypothetical protein
VGRPTCYGLGFSAIWLAGNVQLGWENLATTIGWSLGDGILIGRRFSLLCLRSSRKAEGIYSESRLTTLETERRHECRRGTLKRAPHVLAEPKKGTHYVSLAAHGAPHNVADSAFPIYWEQMLWVLLLLLSLPLFAQPTCPATPAWSPCDLIFDLEAGEKPEAVQLRAEFRSPHHRTYLMYAFPDGDRRLVIRFSPTEGGAWDYKLTSSIARLDGKLGQITASESDAAGFVKVANVHHFQTENNQPHLWMGASLDKFLTLPRAEFDAQVAARAKEKFTHLRVTLDAGADLREAADRIRAINRGVIVADIAFAVIPEDSKEREHYITDVVARFAALNITWAGFPAYENVPHARAILKDAGGLIKKLDAYQHPRTTFADSTSAPLLADGWMNVLGYGTADPNVGGVEHQFYQAPALAAGIKNTHDLWNATMNGQYPAAGSGESMSVWRDFMAGNRYWELEPFFGVDGGRGLALEGIEYIIYVDKAGPIEVTLEHHGYDVAWINPANGERVKQKDYRGERYTGEPPDASHDWILHISREGTKNGMLKSYKFESREKPLVQEITLAGEKPVFEIPEPQENEISLAHPLHFALKVKRDTRATRSLLIEWTAEVSADGEGYRVVGTGREGTLKIPASLVRNFPAVLSLHANIVNSNGKAYMVDRIFRLVP